MKKKSKFLCVLMTLLIIVTSITPCFAAKQDKKEKIRVAFPYQEGLCQVDENGNLSGYTYEYLEKIAQFTGWEYEYVTFDGMSENEALTKSLEMVKEGDVDLLGSILYSDELAKTYEYHKNSYGVAYTTLSVLENNTQINESNFNRAIPLRVAVLKHAKQRRADLESFMKFTGTIYDIVECNSEEEQYKALIDGKADALLTVSLNHIKGTKTIAEFSSRPYYFISTIGNKKMMDQLDKAVTSIHKLFPYFQSSLTGKYFNGSVGDFNITQAERQYIANKKVIRAVCVANSAPFVFEDSNGKPVGISVSIMDDFARKTGLQIEYDIFDENKDFATVWKNGDYDCILGTPVNSSYTVKLGIITSEHYLGVDTVNFCRDSAYGKPLEDCTVALVRTSEIAESIDCKKVIFFKNIRQCVKAVGDGKADMGYGNRSSVEYYADDLFANIKIQPLVGKKENMEFAVSKGTGEIFIGLLNKYIHSIDDDILYSYFSKANSHNVKSEFVLFVRSHLLLSLCMATLVVLLILGLTFSVFIVRMSKKKNEQLQKASMAKSDFLSHMSHDMRTPMNAIISFSSMALDENTTEEVMNAYMKKINDAGKYLLGLINDILDMSKIDSEKMTLNLKPTSVKELFDEIISSVKPLTDERNIEFVFEIKNGQENRYALVDKLRIQQIFINLISNAAKFTKSGGKIECTIESLSQYENKSLERITIKDNGCGMSHGFQKKMFMPFEQEHNEMFMEETGTGLGLAIVKNVVNLMGGTIRVDSEVGKGSTFIIELEITFIDDIPGNILPKVVVDDSLFLGKRILLCEDHPINAEIAKKLLMKKGFKVEHGENGKKAVEMFKASEEGYYDGILMDIRMPVIDGLEASRIIRSCNRKDAKTIAIIAMTANAYDDDVQKSLDAGMNAHLAKPIEPLKLYETLYLLICDENRK